MKLAVALTDASAAVPGLRTISIVVPQARTLNLIQSVATGSYAFVGSAEGDAKLTVGQRNITRGLGRQALRRRVGQERGRVSMGRRPKRDELLGQRT